MNAISVVLLSSGLSSVLTVRALFTTLIVACRSAFRAMLKASVTVDGTVSVDFSLASVCSRTRTLMSPATLDSSVETRKTMPFSSSTCPCLS